MKYVLTAQHYDMAPGTVVYAVPDIGADVFTVDPKQSEAPYLRIVPAEKVEAVDE